MPMSWLVTGSSRGLGRAIAEAVLASGDSLVATARDPAQLSNLVRQYGSRVRAVALDVTDGFASKAAVSTALDAFGRLDVVVNNAGYGEFGPFEQVSEAEFRAQIETNFFGVVNVTRAAMPSMRAQGSGHIIQVSSVGGRIGTPGLTAYQAAKWAVSGFSSALHEEVAPLGIRVTVLEPGGMRTDWGRRAGENMAPLLPAYEPTVGAIGKYVAQALGRESSDPRKVADIVLRLTRHPRPPLRLLLGSDALHYSALVEDARKESDRLWRGVSLSSDQAAKGELTLPDAQ